MDSHETDGRESAPELVFADSADHVLLDGKKYQYHCNIHGNQKNVVDILVHPPMSERVYKFCGKCTINFLYKNIGELEMREIP